MNSQQLKELSRKQEKEHKDKMDRTAVAISYDQHESAPRIVATGKGYLADKILNVAKQEEVPIHKDEALANTLSKLQLGESIPPELYDVVAKILIYVDRIDGMKAEEYKKKVQDS